MPKGDKLREAMDWDRGLCTTGNSLDHVKMDDEIMEGTSTKFLTTGHAVVKEMEASAIGWVCDQFGTDYLMIKAITDFVNDKLDTDEFMQNLPKVANDLSEAVTETIAFINEHGTNI